LAAAGGWAAGTINVSAPDNGAFVGSSTAITFNTTGSIQQVRIDVHVELISNPAIFTDLPPQFFTPDGENRCQGTITWSPSQSFPEGDYLIRVTPTEQGNTYTPLFVERTVTLDRTAPRLREFSPLNNSAINGTITITAVIDEPPANIEQWRVTVNDADLPNNTGSTINVSVVWDPTNIKEDGVQTVKIIVKDKARNESTQTISVRLDREAPVINVTYPRQNQSLRPGSLVTVLVEIQDAASDSVDPLAVVVEIRRPNNTFIRRVARLRYDTLNATTARWVGRWRVVLPPGVTQFNLHVSAVDKAGNVAVPQVVGLRLGLG
jgi:hypothetical protein